MHKHVAKQAVFMHRAHQPYSHFLHERMLECCFPRPYKCMSRAGRSFGSVRVVRREVKPAIYVHIQWCN
jgi:hypothetical protein